MIPDAWGVGNGWACRQTQIASDHVHEDTSPVPPLRILHVGRDLGALGQVMGVVQGVSTGVKEAVGKSIKWFRKQCCLGEGTRGMGIRKPFGSSLQADSL